MRLYFAVLAGLLTAPAFAQNPQDAMYEVADRTPLPGFTINADVADDLDVVDATNRKIGEVEEVVGPNRDTPEALVVDFEDAIAEYGRQDRIIPLSAFSFDGGFMVLADDTAVSDMPIWRDD
ncbi:hypothetical protein ACWCOP_05055 [Maricaulaceae bacterium MS644]